MGMLVDLIPFMIDLILAGLVLLCMVGRSNGKV